MSRQYPSQVIDIHTHVFNARHVPLVGVLVERGVPAFFAKILATILELLTQGDDAETSVDNNFMALYEIEWVAQFIVRPSEGTRNPIFRTGSRPC